MVKLRYWDGGAAGYMPIQSPADALGLAGSFEEQLRSSASEPDRTELGEALSDVIGPAEADRSRYGWMERLRYFCRTNG
jgi:hypothetical protein